MGQASYDFDGETVVVTGASSGIGREIALRFGVAGAAVVVADVQEAPKDTDAQRPTHEAIVDAGGTAEYVETDVSDPDDVERAVDASGAYGGVDVMVNNAGIFHGGSIREAKPQQLQDLYDVNVKGVVFGSQVAANDMVARGVSGAIINTASVSSELGQGEMAAYEVTKGGVKMATITSAVDLATHGIRVNAVAPGDIITEIVEGKTEHPDDTRDDIPLGRRGWPTDVAGAALFLASDDAAYITGELVFIDGGMRIHR